MKMYAWQPKGHGELSFFVMAESESDALVARNKFIAKHYGKFNKDFCIDDGEIRGLDTDYYELSVCDAGQVIINDND